MIGPADLGRSCVANGALGLALLVFLAPDAAVAVNLGFEPFRERIDHRDAHAVQTAGDLVGVVVELAAGVGLGEHHFESALLAELRVRAHGNAASVVADR